MKIFSTDKLLSLSFSGLVFLFFAFLYSFHLNYQEQFQMFLFTGDYFFGYIAKPGAFSDYIGNFFTQFFFYSWIGAIIIASLLTLLQRAVLWISKSLGANSLFIPLSFIPSILYWGLLLDENYLLGGVVVMLVVVAFICVYTLLKPVTSRAIFVLISIPILYWLVGGAFLLLPIFAIAQQIMRHELKKSHLVYFALGCALLSITLPIFCKYSFLQYPMSKVWLGANYYRFPVIIPFSVGLIGLLIIVIPFVLQFLSHQVKPKSPIFILAVQISVLLIGGYLFLAKMSDMKKEELMAYDFNVRMRKWDRVIKLADKKAPSSPLSVTCLNLALAKEGLLSDRMFYYYQNGVEGLLPDFTRDFTIPMIAGEVYYHLGFINTAQRYAFEAMEALPDYQK